MPRMPRDFRIIVYARACAYHHMENPRHPRHPRQPMVRRLQR
jgi:hypothetical protein